MDASSLLSLGLGLEPPWQLVGQHVDTSKTPHEVYLEISSDRGALYPCPVCGVLCKAHDFKEFTWRHLNLFQHHCYVTARLPRVDCPDHGIKRINAPWAREGSRFTLLFEQAAMTLVREMPVLAAARVIGVSDTRLWRVVHYYVAQALTRLDLSEVKAVALDETASKRRHNYVTVFIDLDKKKKPVIFATPGKGKKCLTEFRRFLKKHGGNHKNIVEMVCDMSPAFLAAIGENFPKANVTVDWFHVVQLFTKAVDEVRKAEAKQHILPKATRWAVLKAADGGRLTKKQQKALAELETGGFATATAWRIKEMLRWVRKAETVRAAKWRITHFCRHALKCIAYDMQNLEPVLKALITLEEHAEMILQRWTSTYSNARLEGLNGIFQAARARARGYRNQFTFITMIYFIAAPLGKLIEFHT
jgi:transposase